MLPHTRGGPLYRTLYACRSTAGPSHCTLTARLRLHGPCYRAMVHGTQKEVLLCHPLLVVTPVVTPTVGSRLSRSPRRVEPPICAGGRSPAVHTAPLGQQTPRRSASVRHACAEQPYRLPAIGSRASSACATAKLMWSSACATLPPATHAALLARHKGICYHATLRRTRDDSNSLCALVRPWLAARGDGQRCGRAANDWMRCATRPAHAAPRYEIALCVSQAATGCELQAAERPSPCYRTQRPSIRVPPCAAGPAGCASPTAHRARYRARAHGICAEPHRFCAEGRSSEAQPCYTAPAAARYARRVAAGRARCAPRPENAAPQRVSALRLRRAAI